MMKTKNDIARVDELIAGYFAQGLNKDDLAELQQWLKASVDNKTYFLQSQEVWFSSISANHAVRFDSEKAFQRFLASSIIVTEKAKNKISTKHKTRFFELNFIRVAAAVAMFIVFTGIGYWVGNGSNLEQLADVKVEAPFGSKTKMYLPDGTLVWLNAGSTLSYSNEFGVDNREVELVGEGYFEVTKNKNLSFKVITNEMTVRVLGTKFNFRNYGDESEARVTLLEGSVHVNCKSRNNVEAFLNPNEQIIFDKEKLTARVFHTNATNASEWTKGLIFFDEEKLADIVRELERSYNVKINIIDDSLLTYRFYGNFTRTEQTIDEVLDVLASTGKLKYEMHGKEISLRVN